MLVCHQAFYARTDFAIATPYDLRYRYSADVDWCIRIMKAAAKENVPLHNLHMVVANYTEEGQTTLHHRESLLERFRVMTRHYGWLSTIAMHVWFVFRSGATIIKLDRDRRGYDVKLNNGMELEFNKKFEIVDIDD